MKLVLSLFIVLIGSISFAATPLIIEANEIGVAKFHRYDNKVHAYPANSVWRGFVAPEGNLQTPAIQQNQDGSVQVVFSSLEELLRASIQISQQRNQKIQVLNIHGHGLPGGMWYPKDNAQLAGPECKDWRKAAAGEDKGNYNQYYSPVPKNEIMAIRASANYPAHYACVTGAPEWKEVTSRIQNIKDFFADDAQVHFFSCVVGLGANGEKFTLTVANALLKGGKGLVKTSMNFGLGDWSMPEGMGFWDFQNDTQLDHDNKIYPVDRKDREIAQKGGIRVASFQNGNWTTTVVADQEFMFGGPQYPGFAPHPARMFRSSITPMIQGGMAPQAIRIPGTAAYTTLLPR